MFDDLHFNVVKGKADVLCPLALALFPFMSQSVFGLNCATVPLLTTRSMMGARPLYSMLPFIQNNTLNVLIAILVFFDCKIKY